jgi:hypothetical protein
MANGNEAAPGDEPPAEEPSKKYDQAFFLALAAKGKDAWNAWRREPANNGVRATFAGIDFRVAPWDEIMFVAFEFGDNADFSGCKWRGVESASKDPKDWPRGYAYFVEATFGLLTNFTDATFGNRARFGGATFSESARLGRWRGALDIDLAAVRDE